MSVAPGRFPLPACGAAAAPAEPPLLTPARPLALALQGGGAHGAFTWGVLDRLLEAPGCRIAGISGTSAGALNAAVLAAGYLEGGPAAARERLASLWGRLAGLARFSPLQQTPLETLLLGRASEWSFSHTVFEAAQRLLSPYQLNPLGLNPLRDILVELIDFEALRTSSAIRLIIAATNVETGEARLFTNEELSPEVLLASACLPTLYPAVKLDGAYYWDGGFAANPPILPLVEACPVEDIVLVRLSPRFEKGVPTSARGIQSRLSRIAFDSPLKSELAALAWLRR
ncbi:MAG: patatin-like phospholipase family protein, partial [Alphaproteobacteria bacterium]